MKKNVTRDIYYVGVNDHQVDLFEGQYIVPNGMAYNSYVIMDDLIAVMDTVDAHFTDEWLKNIKEVLGDKKPTYLIVQHMEPDHSANIMNFINAYPDAKIVGNAKTFKMMEQFFHEEIKNRVEVNEGDSLNLGNHVLTFVFAPMVHWPEVMFTYDSTDKVLFSADAFGKFGALDIEDPEGWDCEARRYYIGIVGKYGPQVQAVLKKAATIDIKVICPLHGPILDGDLSHYIKQYDIWSSYQTESEGVAIFYTSVYGHTKEAALYLAELLKKNGTPKVAVSDLARDDMAECVEDAFRYGKIVLATTTYNAGIFPFMDTFIAHLLERNFQNKQIGIIENGSWAPMAAKVIKDKLANSKNIQILNPVVRILSSMSEENKEQLSALADVLSLEYRARREIKEEKEPELDPKALFKIGYGLYVVTSQDENGKDNGLIVNTVSQLTDKPFRVAVNINKANYSHDVIKRTGKLNVNCLNNEAPFSVFQKYGFQSGKDVDKFAGEEKLRSENGLVVLPSFINAFISLKVDQYVDLDTHGMFICSVVESKTINNVETMTYNYYQANVKPKPNTEKKGYVCKVCGYVYEGDNLPEDYICPLCKHGASDFEEIK